MNVLVISYVAYFSYALLRKRELIAKQKKEQEKLSSRRIGYTSQY